MLEILTILLGKQQQKSWWEVLKSYGGGHIALTENGWTNNEIGLTQIKDYFDPQTKAIRKGEQRILLLDGYTSHISTTVIQYYITKKIILLYLPAHTTHILQPLDVGIFGPLATTYKNNVQRATRLGTGYYIDKVDFLEFYLKARDQAVTPEIIQKAWAKAGLSPFNPELILQ